MKKNKLLSFIAIFVFVAVFAGCKKNSSMPVEAVEPPPAQVTETPPPPPPAPDTTAFSEADLEAELAQKIKENLQAIYFAYDEYALTGESLQKIQIAANFLKQQPQIRVRLDGHTDEQGSTEYNLALGEKRAKAVLDALVRYGVDAAKIETTSFGREKPANPNCSGDEACHSLNRRTEYTVIKQ